MSLTYKEIYQQLKDEKIPYGKLNPVKGDIIKSRQTGMILECNGNPYGHENTFAGTVKEQGDGKYPVGHYSFNWDNSTFNFKVVN
jgi:murein L,D-transpeptidase YafK